MKGKARFQKIIRKTAIVLLWLFIWQGAGLLIRNPFLFATPLQTAKALLQNLANDDFWRTVLMTLCRIGAGFFLGVIAGILLATLSKAFPLFAEIISPVISLAKTVPVVCFVVLFLIWWGASFLSVAISFLMVFTAVYFSTLEGLLATDRSLLEMAEVFRLPFGTKVFYLYRPALKPFFLGSLKTALGLAWKSGVAAEVIGVPAHSIGEGLYLAKISLDTAGIFAWTVVTCLLSFGFEKLVLWIAKQLFAMQVPCKAPKEVQEKPGEIRLTNIQKSFGEQKVLSDYSLTLAPGEEKMLSWPSGAGKTTLLRILSGLEKADAGEVTGAGVEAGIGMLFQEDRLLLEQSALWNVYVVTGSMEKARDALKPLLEESLWEKPCKSLSGGERRRVALARALAAGGNLLLLDEPFAGLDEERILICSEEIKKSKKHRTILIASHVKNDCVFEGTML
ncbi:MAG: ATP-binding cassette domain-containing protein [Lachnospiraceae bacterium]|nr:ATP-binding cassette domain-containing protein [Lachnospiraceae bacterium]